MFWNRSVHICQPLSTAFPPSPTALNPKKRFLAAAACRKQLLGDHTHDPILVWSSPLRLPASCSGGPDVFNFWRRKKKKRNPHHFTVTAPMVRFSKAAPVFFKNVGTAEWSQCTCGVPVCVCRESDGWSARGRARARAGTRLSNVLRDPPGSEF